MNGINKELIGKAFKIIWGGLNCFYFTTFLIPCGGHCSYSACYDIYLYVCLQIRNICQGG